MNHIYNQDKFGACVAFATANGVEQQLGVVIPETDIYDYFKKHFNEDVDGVRLPVMLQRMKTTPLCGVKVKSYECLFNDRWADSSKKTLFMSKVRSALVKNVDSVIMILKIRNRAKGEDKIPLDKEGYLVPRQTKVTGYHAVLISRLAKIGFLSFKQFMIVENSWGKTWGRDGSFYIKAKDIHSEAQSIYLVPFSHD